MRAPQRFLIDIRGTALLEFGFIAPIFVFAVFFSTTIGYVLVLNEQLNYATQKSSRQIATGQVQQAGYTGQQFVSSVVCSYLTQPLFDCSKIIVNVVGVNTADGNYPNEYGTNFVNATGSGIVLPTLPTSASTANNVISWCPGNAQQTGGGTTGYVFVQIIYPVSTFLSSIDGMLGLHAYNGGQSSVIMATAAFLNEPFVAPVSKC